MRIQGLKLRFLNGSRQRLVPRPYPQKKCRVTHHAEGPGQAQAEIFKKLSAYFKDFTPMSDVYVGLLGVADQDFLRSTHAVLTVLERKQGLLQGLRNSRQRDSLDVWENPPDLSPKEWMSEVFRQRLHSLARRKQDVSRGNFKSLSAVYAEILADLNEAVVGRAEKLIYAIRKQVPNWWKLDDDNAAEEDLLESVMVANDDLEDFIGEKSARYVTEPELAQQRLKEALGRYSGVGVEMARITGSRLDLPGSDRIGDSDVLNDYFLNLYDFFKFQTWLRDVGSRTPGGFFVGDFGGLTVQKPEAYDVDALSPPDGFLNPGAELRALKRVVKTHLIKQRDHHQDSDRVKPVLLDWFQKLEQTRFQAVQRILCALRAEVNVHQEEMTESDVETDIVQNAYVLGKGLVRLPLEKKYLFFTLKRLANELPAAIRKIQGASDFRDFPTHHLSQVKKLYFISACRMVALLAEIKRLHDSLANDFKFSDLDLLYPELIRVQGVVAAAARGPQVAVLGPPSRPPNRPKTPTLQNRLLEECADLEALLKAAGKIYSQLLAQFKTGDVEPIVGLNEVTRALHITFERAQRAKPKNLGG